MLSVGSSVFLQVSNNLLILQYKYICIHTYTSITWHYLAQIVDLWLRTDNTDLCPILLIVRISASNIEQITNLQELFTKVQGRPSFQCRWECESEITTKFIYKRHAKSLELRKWTSLEEKHLPKGRRQCLSITRMVLSNPFILIPNMAGIMQILMNGFSISKTP